MCVESRFFAFLIKSATTYIFLNRVPWDGDLLCGYVLYI